MTTKRPHNPQASPPPGGLVDAPLDPRRQQVQIIGMPGQYPEYEWLCQRTTDELGWWVPDRARTTRDFNEAHWRETHWWALKQLWADVDLALDLDPVTPVPDLMTPVYQALARLGQGLAIELGIRAWGQPRQVQHVKEAPKIDAGYTNMRQFIMRPGMIAGWQLLIIECALGKLNGYPYPRDAYQSQLAFEQQPPRRPTGTRRVPRPSTGRQHPEPMW